MEYCRDLVNKFWLKILLYSDVELKDIEMGACCLTSAHFQTNHTKYYSERLSKVTD